MVIALVSVPPAVGVTSKPMLPPKLSIELSLIKDAILTDETVDPVYALFLNNIAPPNPAPPLPNGALGLLAVTVRTL